ncbi:MAG: hypothetical protein KBF75_12655 [Saprospiraceae bacterium]|nr:hypothetical protein [Saprospiraceae bacterium]
MRVFVITLLLVSVYKQAFAMCSDTTNLVAIQGFDSIKAETGLYFSLSAGNKYLLIKKFLSGCNEK